MKASVKPFNIQFAALGWVPNFQRNRWFLILTITKPVHDELNRLLVACNKAAEKCGHPGLYTGGSGDGPMEDNAFQNSPTKKKSDAPRDRKDTKTDESVDFTRNFHISIAWSLEEPDHEWVSLLGNIDLNKHLYGPEATFDKVKARIGNHVHSFDLSSRKGSTTKGVGILGLG